MSMPMSTARAEIPAEASTFLRRFEQGLGHCPYFIDISRIEQS